MPKVSVIIPIYNTEKYLNECLDSVLNQTLKDIEIICIDDGSTDNSLKILEEYQKKDNRIKILKQKNLYAGVARNRGIEQASGEFIFFVDSDDIIDKNTLSLVYNAAINNNANIVKVGVACFNEQFNNIKINHNTSKLKLINIKETPDLYRKYASVFCDKLYKTDFVKKYNLKFLKIRNAEDLTFSFIAISLVDRLIEISEELYYYRKRKHSTNLTRNWKDEFIGFYCVQVLLKKYNLYKTFEQSFKNRLCLDLMQHIFILTNFIEKYKVYKYIKSSKFRKFDLNDYPQNKFYDTEYYTCFHILLNSKNFLHYYFLKNLRKVKLLKLCEW